MSRIFLSHSSANNAEAIAVRDWMIAQGWEDLFLDLDPARGLVAGDRWQAALKRAVDRCELVIVLVSPEWVASSWCKAEFLLTKHGSSPKAILPVIVSPTPFSTLPTEMTAEYQCVDLTVGIRSASFTVTLPPGDKTSTVAFSEEGLKRLKIGIARSGIDARHFDWPPAHDPNRPPYRGLKPLEADDAGIFFGRDAAVIGALDQLRGLREAAAPRLLVILGASGSGKSSFLRAGLIPRLARDDRNFLLLPIVRPERAAMTGENGLLRSLEGVFQTAGIAATRAELRAAIGGGAATLRAALQTLAAKATAPAIDGTTTPRPPTLILPIDQGEELFLAEGQDEARTFLGLLRGLLTEDAPAIIALFTIRSDNYERLQLAKELDGLRQATLSLPPMPKGSYAEVIKGPALRLEGTPRALKIDDALVDALLADIEACGAKDALPLLGFTLERLYDEYHAGGRLELEHYHQLGGIAGSIQAAMDHAFKAADADPNVQRDKKARLSVLRRGLIPWLAGIDPDTGAPRRRVARLSEIPADARPLIHSMVEQRLLSTDVAAAGGEATIEPAHEALLRQWEVLRGWLKEDTALLAVIDGVKRATRDWTTNGMGAAWLTHAGDRLRAAERLDDRPDLAALLEARDREYLTACRDAETAGRRRVRLIRASFAGLTLLLAAGGVGWWKQDLLWHQYRWQIVMRPSVLSANQEKQAAAQSKAEFKECANGCPVMVVVPAGTFTMGSADDQNDDRPKHRPPHEVTIAKPFAVSKTEVTFEQWGACVAARACPALDDNTWGGDDRPVINVGWNEAEAYADWLSRLTGRPYRLLSEAEWEYAARAGSPARYAFGDDAAALDQYAWHRVNSDARTQPVGKKQANAFGLHDMHGNVSEWLADILHDDYEGAPSDGQAWQAGGDARRRAIRGGSWRDAAGELASARRDGGTIDGRRYAHVGFRVARTLMP